MQENLKYKTELITDTSSLSDREKDLILFSTNFEWGTPQFKLRHFVGDAQITPYAKFRQFIVELRNREEMVEQMEVDAAKNEAQIAIEIDKMNLANTENEKIFHQIEVNRLINDNNKFLRRLNAAYSERDRLLSAINEMYETGEAYLEDGTEILSIIGTEKEEELEKDYWTVRLAKQAALDMISYGQIGTGNMEAISMMNPDQQVETLGLAITWSTEIGSALEKMKENALESYNNRQRSLQINSLSDQIKQVTNGISKE